LKKHALFFGYRYLDWDFKSGDRLNDLNFHGPYAGVKFTF